MSCSVLQCVAVCCSVLQRGAAWCSMLQYVAVCCSRDEDMPDIMGWLEKAEYLRLLCFVACDTQPLISVGRELGDALNIVAPRFKTSKTLALRAKHKLALRPSDGVLMRSFPPIVARCAPTHIHVGCENKDKSIKFNTEDFRTRASSSTQRTF